MKVRPSVKKIDKDPKKGDLLVRRKGVLRVVARKGTNGRPPGKKRNKQRQG